MAVRGGGSKPKKPGFPSKAYKYPGKAPTQAQLAKKTGRRYEDGSFKTAGGVYDPDTGRIKKKR